MAENKSKNLNADMNQKKHEESIGSTGRSSNIENQGDLGQGSKRTPSRGGFSGSTGRSSSVESESEMNEGRTPSGGFSGSTGNISGESDIESESDVERGSTTSGKLNRDVERSGRS